MNNAIIIKNISKTFRKRKLFSKSEEVVRAVDRVNLEIKAGELFGLLGPNGAGKTTLIKCLSTLLLPDEGTAEILGYDIIKKPIAVRKRIGVTTGGERTLYWKLSVRDNLRYFAALYGIPREKRERRIDKLIELMNLIDKQNERVERLSTGMRQKLSLARALLHDPDVLLLDEPTLGLDPQFSRMIRKFIKEGLNKEMKKTILLTTHYMEEADELCERIAFMNDGKIVACDTPSRLKAMIPYERILELKYLGDIKKEALESLDGIKKSYISSRDSFSVLRIHADDPEDSLSRVIDIAREKSKILSINIVNPTLEDVFVYLTGVKLE